MINNNKWNIINYWRKRKNKNEIIYELKQKIKILEDELNEKEKKIKLNEEKEIEKNEELKQKIKILENKLIEKENKLKEA